MTMNRSALNFVIDLLAFAAFAFLTTTGILTRYVLPPGSGRWTMLWGLDRHQWGDIHFWLAVLLLGVLAVHVILHWRWVVCMVRGKPSQASGSRLALGGIGAIGLLVLAATPLLAPVERIGDPAQRQRSEARPGVLAPQAPFSVSDEHSGLASEPVLHDTEGIRGSMTLREAAQSSGVPLAALIERLGLPAGFHADERIGQMRKRIGISPDDVRQAIGEYRAAHP